MKKALITVLLILFVVPVLYADTFKFMPANSEHIMNTAKAVKSDDALNVLILGYSKDVKYQGIPSLVNSVKNVRNCYLAAGIDKSRTTTAFVVGNGELWKKYSFEKDGVYIKLFRKQ